MEPQERNKLIFVGGVCLLLGLGTGISLTPTPPTKIEEKIVYQDKIKIVEVVKWQTLTKTEEKIVYVKNEARDKHRETTKVISPDGTITIKKTEDDKTKLTSSNTSEKIVEIEKVVYKDRVVEGETKLIKETKVEVRQPEWMLYGMVGTRPLDMTLSSTPPYISPLVIGVGVDKRIVGPFWLGIMGTSDWAFFLKATGEF